MKIKDVSKQWAAILESDEAADAAYGVACEEACNEADMLEQDEIKNFDEDEVSLEECGLADVEDEVQEEKITEADEAAAEEKGLEAFEAAKKETSKAASADEVKEYFENHRDDIKKNIAKIKDPEARERLEKIAKILEKVAKGEVKIEESEGELDEASKTKSAPAQFVKGALRLFVWILKAAPLALLGTMWFGKKVGQAAMWVLNKADKSLAEDEVVAEEEIAEDGVTVKEADMSMVCCGKPLSQWARDFNGEFTPDQLQKMALSGADLQKLLLQVNGQSSLEEADYREPAAHLLDVAGVNASTASLKAQDAAMISVVESLLKKIDKLEDRLDEACKKEEKKEEIKESEEEVAEEAEKLDEYGHQKFDLSAKDGTVSKALKDHIAEWTPQVLQNQQHAAEVIKGWFDEEGVDTPYTQKMLKEIAFFPKFRNVNNIIMYLNNVMQSGMGNKMTYGKSFESEEDIEKIAEEMMEDAVKEADTSFDDEEDDADYPEFDEKGLTAAQRKDYEAAKQIQDLSYERELTKAEEDKFRALLDKLPEIAKDYLLSNTMGKAGFARPGNHVVLPGSKKMPVDDGGGPLNGGKVHYTGEFQEISPMPYQQNPEDRFQKNSLEKRAQRAAEEAAKKNKKIEVPMRGQDVWSADDWKKMYASIPKSEQKKFLEDLIADVRKDYGSDTESAELAVAFIKNAVGKKVTDDDIKDLIVGLTGKEMTKQGAGKRANLYANAIRLAFIATIGTKLSADVREKIRKGIKVPGATGLSAIGIPDKLLVKMSEGDFQKFLKNIRIQLDAIQKRKGGSFKSEEPSDEELSAIEAGDADAGEVKAESEEAEEKAQDVNEDEVNDMNEFFKD